VGVLTRLTVKRRTQNVVHRGGDLCLRPVVETEETTSTAIAMAVAIAIPSVTKKAVATATA
jgi:hypothetical protein